MKNFYDEFGVNSDPLRFDLYFSDFLVIFYTLRLHSFEPT